MESNITDLLTHAISQKASDLHLSAGLSPMIRVNGELSRVDVPIIAKDKLASMLEALMSPMQRALYAENWEIDLSHEIEQLGRFRVNIFNHSRGVGAVFRLIPDIVLPLDVLGLPPIFMDIASFTNGLVLVTGPTGSGKSTTLAAMIDYINTNRADHIVTIEDPIEFIHHSRRSLINQRELNRDTKSYAAALRSALREDPDIVLVGELRDLETIRLAMTAAETGHLVLATLHTNSATQTINRIIDVFPPEEKSMIRSMLSESLRAVIAQSLVKGMGPGRVPVFEIMICNPAIRHLIREDKIAQMYSVIQTGQAAGMQTMDQHLMQLIQTNVISRQVARKLALDKQLFA